MKILIAEDEMATRLILHKMLSSYGDCYLASCEKEAWIIAKMAIDNKSPFSLVCLDITMPPGDTGLELAKKIREHEHEQAIFAQNRSKILVITVEDDIKTARHSFRDAQCDGYLIKPVSHEKLTQELHNLGFSQ